VSTETDQDHIAIKHQVAKVDHYISFIQRRRNVDAKRWSAIRLRAQRTDSQKQGRC
jgi:hypothetical protein